MTDMLHLIIIILLLFNMIGIKYSTNVYIFADTLLYKDSLNMRKRNFNH